MAKDLTAYRGPTPINQRDSITILNSDDEWEDAKVSVVLASQFIANNGVFYFYNDKGLTWKPIEGKD